MDLTTFIRKYGRTVSYIRPSNAPMMVTTVTNGGALPVEIVADFNNIPSMTRTARIRHAPFSRTLKVNENSARYWTYDDNDILAATDHTDRRIQKFSWNPLTGEFLLIPVGQQHASVDGAAPFDDYVRGIILPERKTVTFRPFWPSWSRASVYADFDEENAELSFEAQEACERTLKAHGGQGWTYQYNITNNKLEEMTGVYAKRW
jgi:hypothetical protein